MAVYFTKNNDLILILIDTKKLNMFYFVDITVRKISFEIIRHHYPVLVTKRVLDSCVCFYVNIHFNKNRSSVQQNLKIVLEYWKK